MKTRLQRREVLKSAAAIAAFGSKANISAALSAFGGSDECGKNVEYLPVTLQQVPAPKNITFTVKYPGKPGIALAGHYWYNAAALKAGKKCPAIVELNPYRRRDGLMYTDSMMYPWFAANEYLCFRVDLQGSGDSEGIITDEYTDEEISYCIQVINRIAKLPFCDGNVGMMGKSWSAINSLMVAARDDCPSALKAIIVCCGSDDRYNDDVHYMGGAMMLDNIEWPSTMCGWIAMPPDPVVVGDRWEQMWKQRIRNANFWFEMWASHSSRDAYWSETSVRDKYQKIRVPVFVLSGWQDGYKNSVDRLVRGLGKLGKPVAGLLGPWGHKYPFDGYPGPRIDWLRYITAHWWDRWLKGKQPQTEAELPQLTVWLGDSREPGRSTNFTDAGKWVAEDHTWTSRVKEESFYLSPDHRLSRQPGSRPYVYVSNPEIMLGTAALETSSWGSCGNPDLPDDETSDDIRSVYLDSEPLSQDLDCFGYPTVTLNLECDKPQAVIAVRLSEVNPETNKSHLVTYRFFNLCYRDGDMSQPKPISADPFTVRIPLNITGHVFKRGWIVRLSVSPFLFPTMWQSLEIPRLKLRTGAGGGLPESVLSLPSRAQRADDSRVQKLLHGSHTMYVNPEQYVETVEKRAASNTRTAQPVMVGGKKGTLVKKVFDNGSTILGGALGDVLFDQIIEEAIQIVEGDPLSTTFSGSTVSILSRRDWKTRAVTQTRLWCEKMNADQVVFRYEAHIKAFSDDRLLEEKHIEGVIPRRWV
jgi:putative CocE/NonD family hydrolase